MMKFENEDNLFYFFQYRGSDCTLRVSSIMLNRNDEKLTNLFDS